MLFSALPYDFPLLWTSQPAPASYYEQLEVHLKFLHASPPIIPRILHIAISIGFCGFFMKLFKPSESNLLFDGASLVLYVIGVIVYIANIVKGLRLITLGMYAEEGVQGLAESGLLTRGDSMRVLAASNTILALVLVGVLVLQAGQWYAERKEWDEEEEFEKGREEKRNEKEKEKAEKHAGAKEGHVQRSGSKKRQ